MISKRTVFMSVLILIICFCSASHAGIDEVTIQLTTPAETDNISFHISGIESGGGVSVSNTSYRLNDSLITIDLSLDVGVLTVMMPWDFTYNVGLLSAGTYDLQINSIVTVDSLANSTFTTSFEVIPEPATALLLGLGLFGIRRKSNTNKKLFIKEMVE